MLKLDIQMFANPKLVIETDLNTKKFESGLDRIKDTTQKAGNTVKNIVKALGISKIISVAMNEINNSLDGAISRFDTLNNFPKVMSNLGVGTEEADKAIKKMGDRLSGLPTTLDEAALSVQRLTSKNGDVAKSTDLFLALNNAILAGGAGTQIQSSALEQLSQAYAKGKMDMMEWRTIQMAMPAQLKQIATAMGVTTDELGEMLRQGDDTAEVMDEFMNTIVRLNEEGIEGFENFEKQARNSTGGIKTAITVAKTQVVKGVTDIIGAFNKSFEKTKFGSLSNFISEIGKNAKIGLDEVAKIISGELSLFDFGSSISEMISKMEDGFSKNFPKLFNKGVDLVLEFTKGLTSEESMKNIINSTINMVYKIIDTIIEKAPDILNAGIDIVTNLITGLSNKEPDLIAKLGELTTKIVEKLTSKEFTDKIYQAGGKILVALIVGMIKSIPQLIQAIQQIRNTLTEQLLNLPQRFVRIGADIIIGLWEGIKSQFGNLSRNFTAKIDNLVAGIKKKLKIASPSKRFRDEIGKQMSAGIGVGFEDELSNVYRDMQRAIDMEQEKLVASVETGRVFNTIQNSTPIAININGDVQMDSQKVGRLVTPTVTKTIKNGGGI